MTLLTRDQILQAQDIQREEVPVPEWGGVVLVRAISAAELIQITRQSMNADGQIKDMPLELIIAIPALCIIDEQGHRLFSDADVAALGEKNSEPLRRITQIVQRLSGLDLDGAEAKKD